jgi:ribosome-binding factor A
VTNDRMRRVDEAVREVLSVAIAHRIKDPRVGFVTVTAVQTAPDLRRARVYVSVLGNSGQRRRSLAGLQSAHGILQRQVAHELHLKHTPTLEFIHDDTPEQAMREVLSDALTQDLKDPRVGFVTVTAVDTSPDLRHATVFVSVLGEEDVRADTIAGLQHAHGYLQRKVASELRLKHMPTLQFAEDDTARRADRIERLLEGGIEPA